MARTAIQTSTNSTSLADVLERVLDKGVVIAGDIKVKLVDIELLTIQIRLVVASVDKAREMGLDWWTVNPDLSPRAQVTDPPRAQITEQDEAEMDALRRRIAVLEDALDRESTD